MNIIFYIIIFVIGSAIGSFCASTIHINIRNQNIVQLNSYCSGCGHKLSFFEKIPILSYIFLGGKCKYCNKKINIKYVILEILSGAMFVAFTYTLNINIQNINLTNAASLVFALLYFIFIMLACCSDKENKIISQPILVYGIIISLIYIIYQCAIDKTSIYIQIAYLAIIIILLLIDIIKTKKQAKDSYVISIIIMLLIMLIFTGEISYVLTIIATLITIAFYILIKKLLNMKSKNKNSKRRFNAEIKIAFVMGILNISIFLAILNII